MYRNNSKIGFHKISFIKNNNIISSKIEIKFEVTFLGFVVYDYYHLNNEKWENNTLVSMNAVTDKNGEKLECNLKKETQFKISGTSGNQILDEKITPTTYWNFNELIGKGNKNKVLNSQDCSYIDFKINYLGEELIYDNLIKTSRYKLTGKEASGDDVNIDIWYNKDNWVKMIFLKDGSKIEYFLDEYDKNQ